MQREIEGLDASIAELLSTMSMIVPARQRNRDALLARADDYQAAIALVGHPLPTNLRRQLIHVMSRHTVKMQCPAITHRMTRLQVNLSSLHVPPPAPAPLLCRGHPTHSCGSSSARWRTSSVSPLPPSPSERQPPPPTWPQPYPTSRPQCSWQPTSRWLSTPCSAPPPHARWWWCWRARRPPPPQPLGPRWVPVSRYSRPVAFGSEP